MTACKKCFEAATYAKMFPNATAEEVKELHCNEVKHIDEITGVETLPGCTCRHTPGHRTTDGSWAPRGVTKDVR